MIDRSLAGGHFVDELDEMAPRRTPRRTAERVDLRKSWDTQAEKIDAKAQKKKGGSFP